MTAPRLAAGFGVAGWAAGGLVGYFFEGGLALGLLAGLLAAVLGAVLGAAADVRKALHGRRPLPLPHVTPSDPDLSA